MNYESRIICDSMAPNGARLTTMTCTFPRFVLAELNTHRVFSRNAASSRAIPIEKMIKAVESSPVVPLEWGSNKPGMQAGDVLEGQRKFDAITAWLDARDAALFQAKKLCEGGVHKQIVNRLLEPFAWITVVITSTEWDNFFEQRCTPFAQPEMRHIAEMMRETLENSQARSLRHNEWHLPFLVDDDACLELSDQIKVSVARCARVSYLNHDGTRDHQKDLDLYEKLCEGRHLSPFEHVATALPNAWEKCGNLTGWQQLRHHPMLRDGA